MLRELEKEVDVLHGCVGIACCGTRRDVHLKGGLTDARGEVGAVLIGRSGEGCDLRGGRSGSGSGSGSGSRSSRRGRRSGSRTHGSDSCEKCCTRLLEIRRGSWVIVELTALCNDNIAELGMLLEERECIEVEVVHEKSGFHTLCLFAVHGINRSNALLDFCNHSILSRKASRGSGRDRGRRSGSRDEGVGRTSGDTRGLTSSIRSLCGFMTLAFNEPRRTTESGRRGHFG
jgi:hypothetical protein